MAILSMHHLVHLNIQCQHFKWSMRIQRIACFPGLSWLKAEAGLGIRVYSLPSELILLASSFLWNSLLIVLASFVGVVIPTYSINSYCFILVFMVYTIPSKAKAVVVFLSGFLVLRAAAMSNLLSVLSSSFFCDDLPEEWSVAKCYTAKTEGLV